jgi:hypothetical protein
LVREFAAQAADGAFETLFVIHPDPRQPLPGLLDLRGQTERCE